MTRFVHASLVLSMVTTLVAPLRAMTPPPPPPGGKVFVFGCAVQFSTRSGGTSSTRPGMLNTDRSRRESSLSLIYNLAGFDTTAFQRLADEICSAAPAALTASGYEVVTAGVTEHWAWKYALEKAGESPDRKGIGDVQAVVFAPSGQKLMVADALGVTAASAMMQAETTIGRAVGARPVSLLYTVDFADIEAAKARSRLADQNRAEVKATIQLSVGLTAVSYDPSESKCVVRGAFGEARNQQLCTLKKYETRTDNVYVTEDSLEKRFTDPIVSVDRTSLGGAGVALAAANVLGVIGGTGTARVRQFDVVVDPAKYEAAVREGARDLIAPAMKWIDEPASRPRRGRR